MFRINIDRLRQSEQQQAEASGERPLVVVESDVAQFVTDHCAKHPGGKGAWNGRQIRNAFVIAAGMAHDEAEQQESPDFQPQLRYSHFKQVEKLFDEFVHFRMRVLGKDDAQQALLNEERDDDFDSIADEEKKHVWPSATRHGQADMHAQRIVSPVHFDFARHDSIHQQQGMGISFNMEPHGQQNTQPPNNAWSSSRNASQGYTAMAQGFSVEQSHGSPYTTMQSQPMLVSRAGIHDIRGYEQRHIQGQGSYMANSQAPQQGPAPQISESRRQLNTFGPGVNTGEYSGQGPVDRVG